MSLPPVRVLHKLVVSLAPRSEAPCRKARHRRILHSKHRCHVILVPAGNKGGGREETMHVECIGAFLGGAKHKTKRRMHVWLCVRRRRRCGESTYEMC